MSCEGTLPSAIMFPMKITAAILVVSLFVPTLCEVGYAWAAAAQPCTEHQSQQQPDDNSKSACCLVATLDRPAVKEHGRSQAWAALLNVAPSVTLVSPVVFAAHHSLLDHQERLDRSPAKLWVLNTAFLI